MTDPRRVRIVAFGGGHGLAASLTALREINKDCPLDITAVVTVGDDGGSSGRLRVERGGLPPGDLRQALAALADRDDPEAARTADLLQHRFTGEGLPRGGFAGDGPGDGMVSGGALTGHAVGNLLLCGLTELLGDPVAALDHVSRLVRSAGRVLPMSRWPVSIEADVCGADPSRPGQTVVIRGQHAVASSRGTVTTVRIAPTHPAVCEEVIVAIDRADWLIFGPGSWYTSVIPHLLVPDLAAAIVKSPARRMVVLNLVTENETAGLSLPGHLAALHRYLPTLRVDVVIADHDAIGDPVPVRGAAESLGARLVLAPVAVADGAAYHNPVALAATMAPIVGETG